MGRFRKKLVFFVQNVIHDIVFIPTPISRSGSLNTSSHSHSPYVYFVTQCLVLTRNSFSRACTN